DGPFMTKLAAPGGPLLELPIDDSVVTQPGIVYRSIFHRRALINGYSGYYPEGFRARRRLAMALPDAAALAALERFTGLELILVHTAALPAARRDEWLPAPPPPPE